MSWRKTEEPGPTRLLNGVKYLAYHNPEQFPDAYVWVEQHGGAGGPRKYVVIHDDADKALEAGKAFAQHLRDGGIGIRHVGGTRKEKWWLSFSIDSLD